MRTLICTMEPLATWIPVRNGALAVSSRPKKSAFEALATRDRCTHVFTLLSEREEARAIGDLSEAASMEWIWLPLENGQPPSSARDAEILTALGALRRALDGGARVLVHCSAGIHRTGMLAYALLRFCGVDADGAREALASLRTVTAEGVGDRRLAWAEEMLLRARGGRRPPQ